MEEEEASRGAGEGPQEEAEEQQEAAPGEAAARAHRRADRVFLVAVIVLVCAYIALFGTLSLMRYTNFRAASLDTGIFNQVIWLMSRFKSPVSSIRGMNLYGDHMAPILVLLVPLYWIRGNVPALLMLQTVALGLGAVPIYLLARGKLESRGIALAIAAAYLCYPALHYLNLFDFHPEALGLCFLLFAFLAADRRRFGWFYTCCALAAFCKEDMVLAVIVLAVLVYFLYDKRPGWIVATAGSVYFLATVLFILPAIAPAGYAYSGRLGEFGKTPAEAVRNMVLHPLHTFGVLATRINLTYTLELLLPVAFICALAPVYLLPALPAFFINVISDYAPQHSIEYQYTAAIIPFVFIALVFGVRRFRKWSDGAFRQSRVLYGLAAVVLLCSFAAGVFYGPSPVGNAWRTGAYTSDAHVDVIREGLAMVPKDASVSAQIFLAAHLSEREKLYIFPAPFVDSVDRSFYNSLDRDRRNVLFPGLKPGDEVPLPQYVALDKGTTFSPLPDDGRQYRIAVSRLLKSGAYRPVFDKQGVLILKRTP